MVKLAQEKLTPWRVNVRGQRYYSMRFYSCISRVTIRYFVTYLSLAFITQSGPNGELPQGAGVIPRAIKQIFDTLESQNAEYSVKVTFLELYNEEITDLLAPEDLSKVALEDKQKKQLPLMEDGKGGVLVRGLEEEIVTCASEIFTLLERGSAKRRTAETLLNKQSRCLLVYPFYILYPVFDCNVSFTFYPFKKVLC